MHAGSFYLNSVIVWTAGLLAGCANHPVIDDKTGRDTYAIIHKVRCEAREEIEAYYSKKNFGPAEAEYDLIERASVRLPRFEDAAELQAMLRTKTSDLRRVLARLSLIKDQIAAALVVDKDVSGKANAEDQGLMRLIEQIRLRSDDEKLIDLALERARALLNYRKELVENRRKLDRLIEEGRYLDALQRTQRAAISSIEKKLSGQSIAAGQLNARKSQQHIRDLVEYWQNSIVMQFRFEISEKNHKTAEGSFSFPIPLGTLKISFDAGARKDRLAKRTVAVEGSFRDLLAVDCLDVPLAPSKHAKVYPITGNTGMRELVAQFLKVKEKAKIAKSASIGKALFTDTLTFTTELFGDLKPTLDIKPTPKQSLIVNGAFSNNRKDIHEVVVDIAPSTGLDEKSAEGGAVPVTEQRVIIDHVPELSVRSFTDRSRNGSARQEQ